VHDLLVEQPILLLGIFLAGGFATSLFLKRYGVPHVVVYLLTGFLIANTLLRDFDVVEELDTWFLWIETVALGLIGFRVGHELKISIFSEEPKFLIVILLAEAGGALVLVFSLVYTFTQDLALAIVLGGLATATAPAATVEILRKFRAKGDLTTRLQWVMAFDDVLAVMIVEMVLVIVVANFGQAFKLSHVFIEFGKEVGVAILLGIVIGVSLDLIVERMTDDLEMMELTLGVLVFAMGMAHWLDTSVISTTMVLGATVTNLRGDNYEKAGDLLEIIMSPVVMLFFVFVGARVHVSDFSPLPWLAGLYLLARTFGKITGTLSGGRIIGVEPKIRDNLGLGLLAQGGVALGLAAVANDMLVSVGEIDLGTTILTTVIISTIFSEILGSYGTKIAITRAGEIGKARPDPDPLHTRHTHDLDAGMNGDTYEHTHEITPDAENLGKDRPVTPSGGK
jgi:NhaP-type Na+/H+ or K+/H+ antiporter